jgi:heme a synthase
MRLVEHDKSIDRAVSIAFHLVNTLFLLATIVLVAQEEKNPRWLSWRRQGSTLTILLAFAFLGALGALTALGDTLFPPSSLQAGVQADFAEKRHFLERIRIVHPIFALLWFAALLPWTLGVAQKVPALQWRTRALLGIVAFNLLFGLANVIALAPVWMQMIHLLLANLIWIFLVSTAFSQASRWQE